MNKKEVGDTGEKLARDFLKKKGYRIVETNFRCRAGEIDLITEKKKTIVFVEVRTKTSEDFGNPEESVTSFKKERLIKTASTYLNSHDIAQSPWRIDFIGIELTSAGKLKRIEHLENAVTG